MSVEAERVPTAPTTHSSTDGASISRFSWKRTSLSILAACEEKILSCLSVIPEGRYVPILNGTKRLWTLSLNQRAAGTPLVMLHGMGSGVALWVLNLESLSRSRPVYAIDMLGFGRSTRSKFSTDAREAEMEFVNSIEEWRSAMKLEKMILLGHSLGGYLAAAYALHHADRVKHLILADPWGFPPRPPTQETLVKLPLWAKVLRTVFEPFNPLAILRMAGPWGPNLVIKIRGDLLRKYSHMFSDDRIGEYIYHCNAQPPSGEAAFKSLTHEFGWAKHPMIERVQEIPASLSMTLIYGSRSWVDYGVGYQVKYKRPDSYVNVEVIREAGHHVYADKAEVFNNLVGGACDMADRHPQVNRPRSHLTSVHSRAEVTSGVKNLADKTQQTHGSTVREQELAATSSTGTAQSSTEEDLIKLELQEESKEEDIVSGGI